MPDQDEPSVGGSLSFVSYSDASETAPLSIRLFGPADVRVRGVVLPRLRSRRGLWLLALLALRAGRSVDRLWLAGTLWPDSTEENALVSLRQTLTDLRRALGLERGRIVSSTSRTLCLDVQGIFCDVLAFDLAVQQRPRTFLEDAVRLRQRPLLEDCYEEWVQPERQVREQSFLSALETLAASALEQERWDQAADWLRKIVAADPYRESARRELMTALARAGSPGDAVWVFRDLRLLLQRELRSQPAAETLALYHQIRADAHRHSELPAHDLISDTPHSLSPPEELPKAGGNLPKPLTGLIGRENDLGEIGLRLFQSRLVSLTGMGGVGKTRLAIQVAEEWSQDQPEGVWFLELASLSDPAMVPQAVAALFGAAEQPGISVLEILSAALREKRLLLVLDNCEHLVEACALLAEHLLKHCPRLRILVTSRQTLGVPGEVVWSVLPLSLPASRESWSAATMAESSAVRLFVERARAIQPGFALADDNAAEIAEICCRLDGLPLALELAAARIRILSPKQIAARLAGHFDFLDQKRRTAVSRQQTLRALLDWSYDLLSEPEGRLLMCCSVFVGGWSLAAAEFVCRTEDGENAGVLDALLGLADKSLIQFTGGTGLPRYRMLETVRQYARMALGDGAYAREVSCRHRDWLLALVEQAQPHFRGPEQISWLARLEVEHDNLRAALDFSHRDTESAPAELALAAGIWRFWMNHGHFTEGRARLTDALSRAGETAPVELRLSAMNGVGALALHQGDLSEARLWMEQALNLARQTLESAHLDSCLHNLGNVLYFQGELAAARTLWEESLVMRQAAGDLDGASASLSNLGSLAYQEGDLARAETLHSEALSYANTLNDPHKRRAALVGLAEVRAAQGDDLCARCHLEEALALSRDLDDRECISGCLTELGRLAARAGEWTAAWHSLQEALAIAQKAGMKPCMVYALEVYGELALATGDARRAALLWRIGESQRHLLHLPRLLIEVERYNQQLACARQLLGDEAFDWAWNAGSKVTLDDAVASVLAAKLML